MEGGSVTVLIRQASNGRMIRLVFDRNTEGGLSAVVTAVERELGIRSTEVVLLTENGIRIRADSPVGELFATPASWNEVDVNSIGQVCKPAPPPGRDANECTLYAFDQARLLDGNTDIPLGDLDGYRERFYEADKKIFDEKLFRGAFEDELDLDELPLLKKSDCSETISVDKKYFQHFRFCKSLLLKFNEKLALFKGSLDRGNYQVKAVETLMRHAVTTYE
jgi:hypothetical protein